MTIDYRGLLNAKQDFAAVQPPRRESNPGHRPMASPTEQGRLPFGAGTDRGLFDLALTVPPSPPCRCGPGRRADYLPVCRGSVDCLAAASTVACRSHVYEGRHLSREAAPCADAFFAQEPGISAGCVVVREPCGHTPARVRSFECVVSSFHLRRRDVATRDALCGR